MIQCFLLQIPYTHKKAHWFFRALFYHLYPFKMRLDLSEYILNKIQKIVFLPIYYNFFFQKSSFSMIYFRIFQYLTYIMHNIFRIFRLFCISLIYLTFILQLHNVFYTLVFFYIMLYTLPCQ